MSQDERLERVVCDVVARAVRFVQPERVWLFGSHASGSATRSSDIDFAFRIPAEQRQNWSRFVLETEEEVPALVELDLVDIDTCAPELTTEILRTGRIVYERNDELTGP